MPSRLGPMSLQGQSSGASDDCRLDVAVRDPDGGLCCDVRPVQFLARELFSPAYTGGARLRCCQSEHSQPTRPATEQANGSVTHASAVSSGVEDYYPRRP